MNLPTESNTSLRRWLDAFVALPDRWRLPLGVALALLVHLLLFFSAWILPKLLAVTSFILPSACTVKTIAAKPTPTPAPLEIVLEPPPPEPAAEGSADILTVAEAEMLQQRFQQLPEEIQREYIDIEGLAKKKNLSKRALLESWADSVAGSRKPGKGDSALPSQEGRTDLPFTNFKDQQANVGSAKELPSPPETRPKLPIPGLDPTPIYKPEPVSKPELNQPNKIPKTASTDQPTPTPTPRPTPPPPAAVAVMKPTPPPDLRKVETAAADEIPLFVDGPPRIAKFTGRMNPLPMEVDQLPKPEPTPKPTPVPTPEPTPLPKPTPSPTATPPPKPEATPKPTNNRIEANRMASLPRPTPVKNPGYSPHMEKRKIEGGNLPEGENGVDAVATDRGRYMKALNQAVGSRWTYYVRDARQASLITAGSVTLKFALNSKGKITKVQVTDNTSNRAHASLCERAFLESQPDIDPPPRELLRGGVFEDTFTFTLY